jgi:mycothiol synthase
MKDPRKWQLAMIIENLRCHPETPRPQGYTLRSYQSGDEEAWERIVIEAFHRPQSFQNKIMQDGYFRPERVLFICHSNHPVATACAWHVPNTPEHIGYLYMVGALKTHQGKGLGYTVCGAALNQMVRDQKTSAMLFTDASRLAAIKTYLKLGFEPSPLNPNQLLVWDKVLEKLKR